MRNFRRLWRRDVTALGVFAIAAAMAMLLGRWLAIGQEPPTRQAWGERLLASGRPDDAAHLFADPLWQGVAFYRAGRYQRAAAAFAADGSLTGLFDMANADALLGRYDQAIAALETVLERAPGHEDARHNLEVIRAAADLARRAEAGSSESETANGADDRQRDGSGEEQGAAPEAADPGDSEAPQSEAAADEPDAAGGQTTPNDAPPASKGAGGSQQADDRAEATSVSLEAAGRDEPDRSSDGARAEDEAAAAGDIERRREEAMADEIVLRRIEDDPALVLKARLTMALRKQQARR